MFLPTTTDRSIQFGTANIRSHYLFVAFYERNHNLLVDGWERFFSHELEAGRGFF